MNCFQFSIIFIVLSYASRGALGGLLPGDNGYQYDRPTFTSDFGRRTNVIGNTGVVDSLGRFSGRPNTDYGPPLNGNFGTRQPNGFGFPGGQTGYQGYQGYQGNNLGYQGNNLGYPGYQGNYYQGYQNDGSYQGFDNGDNSRAPMPYSFQYEVRDAASGNDYGQQESGDVRGIVRGEYRVLLPDSRTQIVRYTADDANGYVADVRYEGQAQYPRTYNNPGGFFGGAIGPVGYQPIGAGRSYNGVSNDGNYPGYNNQYLPPNGK